MPELHDHRDFAAAFAPGLLDPDAPTPASVTGPSGKRAVKRFNVYRNGVTASLVTAMGQIFPLTARALGEGAFRVAALTFVRAHPPVSKLLFEFGAGFDRHLAAGGFAGEGGWVADLARLERAWLDAYHAADAAPLAPQALAGFPQERLAYAVFRVHPATRLVASATPAVSVMATLKQGGDAAGVLDRPAETALVTRPALAVDVRALEGAYAAFFGALVAGVPLGAAAETAAEAGPFDLAAALGAALESGAFTAIDDTGAEPAP